MEQELAHCSTSDNFCESTPGTISKRKRKISQDTLEAFKSPLKGLDWSLLSPVPIFEPRGLLSSTHNENFTHNFENFSINSKGEDSVWLSNTVPTTPTKSTLAGTSALLANTSKLAPSVKLGSPERNSILYPSLRSTRKPRSPFSPFSTANTKRNSSPAKKRLFNAKQPPITHADPVKYLNTDTMSLVYTFLQDADLYTCTNVSRAWRRSVKGDRIANGRLERFSVARELNKENWGSALKKMEGEGRMDWTADESCIKKQGKILQYYSLSRTLSDDQSLLKCMNCHNVAIVTDSISQCQSGTCNYITCLKCGSFSTSGHQNFLDKCRQMKLELDSPDHHCTPEKRRNTIYTFSTTSSSIQTPSSSTSNASSGYFTDSNGSNRSSNNSSQRRMSEINLNHPSLVLQTEQLKQQQHIGVLSPSSVPNLQSKPLKLKLVPTTEGSENIVPPSPPSPSSKREKRGAKEKPNRKASTRRLRRLLL